MKGKKDVYDNKSRTGIRLLRTAVLILCGISLRNTALGLKAYVFTDAPVIAFLFSLVFQGIIAVVSLQGMRLVVLSDETGTIRKFNIKKLIVPVVFFVAFLFSIFFDYVYVVNSTYKTTEKDDIANGFATEFAYIKNDITEQLNTLYNEKMDESYEKIEKINPYLSDVGDDRFSAKWKEFWDKQKEKYTPAELRYSIYELAREKSIDESPTGTPALNRSQVEGEKEKYATAAVYAKIMEVINQVTLLNPQFITSTEIDGLNEMMDEAQDYFETLIKAEYTYLDNSQTNSLEKEKVGSDTETNNQINEETVDADLDKGEIEEQTDNKQEIFEEIFSHNANEAGSSIENLRGKANKIYQKDKREIEQSEAWKDYKWKERIEINRQDMLRELSQKRIAACQEGISVIDGYERVLMGLKEDARYNLALLVHEISSAEVSELKEIDNITSKISQVIFAGGSNGGTGDENNVAGAKEFRDLKKSVSEFIPIKNAYILLRSFEFSTNNKTVPEVLETEKDEESEKEIAKDEERKKDEEEIADYRKKLKTKTDLLIDNLMAISVTDNNGVIDQSFNEKADESIDNLFALERMYLNEKNEMVKAVDYILGRQTLRDNKIGDDGSKQVESNSDNNGRVYWLAWFAALFAVLVDGLSLALGYIVQKWEDRKGSASEEIAEPEKP